MTFWTDFDCFWQPQIFSLDGLTSAASNSYSQGISTCIINRGKHSKIYSQK